MVNRAENKNNEFFIKINDLILNVYNDILEKSKLIKK